MRFSNFRYVNMQECNWFNDRLLFYKCPNIYDFNTVGFFVKVNSKEAVDQSLKQSDSVKLILA